jgi:hypothetical protein
MAYDGREVVFHEPFFDEMRLREGAPDFLWRKKQVPFHNN